MRKKETRLCPSLCKKFSRPGLSSWFGLGSRYGFRFVVLVSRPFIDVVASAKKALRLSSPHDQSDGVELNALHAGLVIRFNASNGDRCSDPKGIRTTIEGQER